MVRPRPQRDLRCKHEGRVSAEDQEALKQLKGIVLVLKPSTANDKKLRKRGNCVATIADPVSF